MQTKTPASLIPVSYTHLALSNAGYNLAGGEGCTVIPVFGVDATDAAKELIANKQMTGSSKQDAEGMADAVATITANLIEGKDKFEGLNENYEVVDGWTVNIPVSYTHLAMSLLSEGPMSVAS